MVEEKDFLTATPEIVGIPEKQQLSIAEIIKKKKVSLSSHRIRRLLNTGRIKGEKVRRKTGRGYPWVWQTSVEEISRYLASLLTPSDYGKKGGRPRKKKVGIA